MSVITKNEKNFVGYEYKDVTVKHDSKSVYADGYTHFGWTLEGTSNSFQNVGSVSMKFKRNRKIRNKAELTRLQRQFEACVTEIETLERSKIMAASVAAYVIGIVGTAFMAGSVFAYLSNMLSLSVILAIPGFAGWIIPYFCFRGILKKKTDKVAPFIDKKYDEIYEVCEKANGLLAK
ncbi:hypothetical protein SAMN04487969_101810 [Paenibacillus algorifonticola]|uniref:Uncharacterized protein n=1 Tax=Paenibacillus algorifonticola TaxID=684063 RepID=A0A1I1YV40_9BACL|nr:hypothetical protein [Paenibacillus algorifonticola]SFE23426.1 hypothetical protein SAMN04487969_101810 [Paenibacillus algorifonticola]